MRCGGNPVSISSVCYGIDTVPTLGIAIKRKNTKSKIPTVDIINKHNMGTIESVVINSE
ncbi:hypothetical protein Hanom_Chr04g00336171 [Helianthus anomalus]